MSSKVVLITGASSGIGEATALRLHKRGFIVYAAARRVERMKHLKQQGVNVMKLDVTDEESMVSAVHTIVAKHGAVDILINNAGYGSYGALEDVPLSEGRRQFEVNVFGLARMTQLVLPHMRRNRYGKIVNVSSIGGKIYTPLANWYGAAKFAVEGMSDCLRMEVKEFGIDVIVIEPGGIKTEWADIARSHLLETSGNTAYKEVAGKMARLLGTADRLASDPEIIAKVIEKSIAAARPKTRYAAGAGAGILLFLRRISPDRVFDRIQSLMIDRLGS